MEMKYNHKFIFQMNIARILATQGNCKKRNYGCVIATPQGDIIATGYTHSEKPCKLCKRRFARKGTHYERCPSLHAERHALSQLNVEDIPVGSVAFLACFDEKTKKEVIDPRPCHDCEEALKAAGIKKVYTLTEVIDYEA